MDTIETLVGFFVHLDQHLGNLIVEFGPWVYGILFLIIFCETGLVVTPFLPGDSLLFVAGALAASTGHLQLGVLWLLLSIAAILGDSVNYSLGSLLGTRIFREDARILKTRYLRRTEAFYERHGNKTIVLARFVPIVRTFAPFVAGVASMNYRRFVLYNVLGGLLWVTLCMGAGYLFGNIPGVKEHVEWVTIGIVLLSLVPVMVEAWRGRRGVQSA